MPETHATEDDEPRTLSVPDSLSLNVAVAGGVMAAAGFVINEGVLPAIMVIWGVTLVLIGSISYAILAYRSS